MSNLLVTSHPNELLRNYYGFRLGGSVACPGSLTGISVAVQSADIMTKAWSHFAKNECSVPWRNLGSIQSRRQTRRQNIGCVSFRCRCFIVTTVSIIGFPLHSASVPSLSSLNSASLDEESVSWTTCLACTACELLLWSFLALLEVYSRIIKTWELQGHPWNIDQLQRFFAHNVFFIIGIDWKAATTLFWTFISKGHR